MIAFNCKDCGQAINVTDDLAGKQGKCPKCGAVLTVPASSAAAGPPPAPAVRPQAIPPANIPPGVASPAAGAAAVQAQAGPGGMAIASLILGCSGFFFAGVPSLIGLPLGIAACVSNSRKRRSMGVAIAGTITSGVSAFMSLILVAILVPVIGSALDQARKTSCQANLKIIGSSIREYERSKDAMPSKPWDMVEAGYLPSRAFKCGADEDWRDGQSSYFFQWSTRRPDEEGGGAYNAIIACDLKHNHGNGRAYLTRAGNVGWMSEMMFQSTLDHPENAAFATALRAFEAAGAKHVTLDQTRSR